MTDVDAINAFLQQRVRAHREPVTAIQAARWLDEAGVLRDSRRSPGLPLRNLLRAGRIDGSWQESGRWWFIGQAHEERRGASPASSALARVGGAARLRADQPRHAPRTDGIDERSPARPIDSGSITWEALEKLGFCGFVTFEALRGSAIGDVPPTGGIYVVLREGEDPPAFGVSNPGGWFKDRDPTVDPQVLESSWVIGAPVLYIGKGDDLRRRIKQFARFGAGTRVGHWGGRYIWQLEDADDLVVAWKETPSMSPRDAEIELLARFVALHGRRPFANLVG